MPVQPSSAEGLPETDEKELFMTAIVIISHLKIIVFKQINSLTQPIKAKLTMQ